MIFRLTPENSLLLILDVQTRLLPEIWEAQRIERNCAILARVARRLEIPVVVTEQNSARLGGTANAIQEALGGFSPIEKMSFSGFHSTKNQVEMSGRKTILLCGLESHICVMQSGLDLIEAGYTVFAVGDAMSSRQEPNRRIGWERLKLAGAIPTSTESAVFELMQTAESPHFKAILGLIK
ncbi:Nicotinamidase-related amidase [Abditibacterium utsteinense]|uniref:Nicotinamidase-related amidase n=1 Tax=Abditibacterium utsteinense TaxID=1960156 RepID=A0A2S8SWV4_9BACT|nr:isochorismatase family protein [Abditibacterium utsteinense]PQV65254.1 Nicotinamidase-related amidase [Abditibacterium utsteinense]